jgi:hypothetical protein
MMRGADERTLIAFVAARVVDARARVHLRKVSAVHARPLPGAHAGAPALHVAGAELAPHRSGVPALVIPLAGDAWCVLPASHPAHHSAASARQLLRELARALHVPVDALSLVERDGVQA